MMAYVIFFPFIADNSSSRVPLDSLFPIRPSESKVHCFLFTQLLYFAIIMLISKGGSWGQSKGCGDDDRNEGKTKEHKRMPA